MIRVTRAPLMILALDPRLTPARADLAAADLRGRVEASRYVEGRACYVVYCFV